MELESVNKSVETIQASKQKYLNLYETDLIDQEMFKGRIKELNDEVEEVVIKDKKVQEIKLKIDEQVQEDITKKSLSDKKSDGDILCLEINAMYLELSCKYSL